MTWTSFLSTIRTDITICLTYKFKASVTQAFAIVSCRSVSKAENMASHMSFAKHATGALARRLTAPATADLLLILIIIVINQASIAEDCLNKLQSASPAHGIAPFQSASHKATGFDDMTRTFRASCGLMHNGHISSA
jgi:hypothetical protein